MLLTKCVRTHFVTLATFSSIGLPNSLPVWPTGRWRPAKAQTWSVRCFPPFRFPKLSEGGEDPSTLVLETLALLQDHLTFNGHPRFLGYITASPSPIGALAYLVVSTLNPNLGLWLLSPLATEIELQTVRWLAEFLVYPERAGGVMSSGGSGPITSDSSLRVRLGRHGTCGRSAARTEAAGGCAFTLRPRHTPG